MLYCLPESGHLRRALWSAFACRRMRLKAIDTWARKQDPPITRPYAIRRLVELGLKAKTRSAPSDRQRATLADLAAKAIDSLTAETAENNEKASRKRRLLKGPEEFREVRVDRPKGK